jgi:hypothetical protein
VGRGLYRFVEPPGLIYSRSSVISTVPPELDARNVANSAKKHLNFTDVGDFVRLPFVPSNLFRRLAGIAEEASYARWN